MHAIASLPRFPWAPAPQELEFPGTVSATAKDLVLRLLEPTVERRLGGGARGLDDVIDHPFFEGVDVASLYSSTPPPVEHPAQPRMLLTLATSAIDMQLPVDAGG